MTQSPGGGLAVRESLPVSKSARDRGRELAKRYGRTGSTSDGERVAALTEMRAYEVAIEEARRVLAESPHNDYVRGHMLYSLLQLGRFEDVLAESEVALRLNPGYEWHYRARALAFVGLRRWEEGLPLAKEALRLAPQSTVALQTLAHVQLYCGDYASVEETGRRYISLNPDAETGHHLIGNALRLLGKREQAWEELRRARQLGPMCAGLHVAIAFMYLDEGETRRAVQEQLEAMRLVPAEPEMVLNLCYFLRHHVDRQIGPALTSSPSDVRDSALGALSSLFYILSYESPGRRPLGAGRRDHLYLTTAKARTPVEMPSPDNAASTDVVTRWLSTVRDKGDEMLAEFDMAADARNALLDGNRGHDHPPLSLASFVERWAVAIQEIEEGYPRTFDAYVHDLLLRDHLEQFVVDLPSVDREVLREFIAGWDERFRGATNPGNDLARREGSVPWWWLRRPRNAPGFELAQK